MSRRLRPWLLLKAADGLMFLGVRRRAVALLEQVKREYPEEPRAWIVLGFLYAGENRLGEAIEALERALTLRPGDEDLRFNSAYVLQRAGRHEDAMARFRAVIEARPKMDRAWYGLGLSLAHAGRYEEAALNLREAAKLQPMNPYAGYQLAAALHKLGRQDEVRKEHDRIKGFDPKIAAQMRRDFSIADG